MSTTNLGIIKSEANPLTGTRVQLNTGGWFIAESSAIQKSKIESNKTQTITENGTGIEITPSSGKEAMEKVTLTVNVPTTSVTPPEWFTNGKDSVIPDDTTVAMANLSEQSAYQTINFNGNGEKTIAELATSQGITLDTLTWLWNSNGVMILGYTNE